ncbi:MAG: hypothetical protein Kow0099_13910 [Candidatus Abyssubacteria bacterium]
MHELIQRAIDLPWGFIMSTLVIRFVGVFIVLAILMVGMQILGTVVSRMIAKQESKHRKTAEADSQAIALVESQESSASEEETAAVIGAAIALAMESERASAMHPGRTAGIMAGSWAMAGRVAQMSRRMSAGSQRRP